MSTNSPKAVHDDLDALHQACVDRLTIEREDARARQTVGPRALKCRGELLFRSQLARDCACLFDVDPDVRAWECLPETLYDGADEHVPDFVICRSDGPGEFVDAFPGFAPSPRPWRSQEGMVVVHRQISADEIRSEPRLTNARDLLRYGSVKVSLADRVKLMAHLEDGSQSIGDVLRSVQLSIDPVAAIAALAVQGHLSMDIETALIGPETSIRRRKH